ncbi:hypothetical protein AN651_01335 [Xanthomonas arboricola]|nr:hypothetical protein AN651_01335 [Xanthomonas arboricola]
MKQVDMYKRIAMIALMGVSLAGCSTVKGWFAGKDAAAKKAQEPAELVKFEPSVKVDKIWSTGVGKGEGHIGVRQRPAVADGKVYAAAITGGVQALDLQTGKRVWEYKPKKEERNDRKFKQRLSGGPGAGKGPAAKPQRRVRGALTASDSLLAVLLKKNMHTDQLDWSLPAHRRGTLRGKDAA